MTRSHSLKKTLRLIKLASSISLNTTVWALLCCQTIPLMAQQASSVTATARLISIDGLSRPAPETTLALTHQPGNPSPRIVTKASAPHNLKKIRVDVVRSGLPLAEAYILQTFSTVFTATDVEEPDLQFHTSDSSKWVERNSGALELTEVKTGLLNAPLSNIAAVKPDAFTRITGTSYFARVEDNDRRVPNSIPFTHADMVGVRKGLESAMNVLRDVMIGRFDRVEAPGENFTVSRDGVLFVPKDSGRKAAPFILRFKVRKTWLGFTHEATLMIPVSFLFERNSGNDGISVQVDPRDEVSSNRITVRKLENADIDANKILRVARESMAGLDRSFFETTRERLQRAVADARPARELSSSFEIIMLPAADFKETSLMSDNPLELVILE